MRGVATARSTPQPPAPVGARADSPRQAQGRRRGITRNPPCPGRGKSRRGTPEAAEGTITVRPPPLITEEHAVIEKRIIAAILACFATMLGSCTGPAASPTVAIQTRAEGMDRYFDEVVTIEGRAGDGKAGGLVTLSDHVPIYLDGLRKWPTALW